NSSRLLNYSYVDSYPLQNISYYRLTQTDYDGTQTHSSTVAVNFNKPTTMITLFPNPASGTVYLNINWYRMPKDVTYVLSLMDSKGNLVIPERTVHLSYGMLYPLDISTLAKGVYIIQLTGESTMQSEKLIVQN